MSQELDATGPVVSGGAQDGGEAYAAAAPGGRTGPGPGASALARIDGQIWRPDWRGDFGSIFVAPLFGLLICGIVYAGVVLYGGADLRATLGMVPEVGLALAVLWFVGGAGWRLLVLRCLSYRFGTTPEGGRLVVRSGVLNRSESQLELMRVRDATLLQPFVLRMFGLSDLRLETDDRSDPVLLLRSLGAGPERLDLLLEAVGEHQRRAGYREASVT